MGLSAGDITAILRLRDEASGVAKSAEGTVRAALSGMASASASSSATMAADQAKLKDQLKTTEQTIRDLEKAVKDYASANPATNPLPKMLADARDEAARLKTELGNTAAALKAEQDAADAAARATKGHTDAQGEDEKALRKRLSALQEVATGMKSLGDTLTLTVSAPLLAGVAASVHFASDFEANLNKVQTLAGASGDEIARLRDKVLQLAPAVGIGPGELAKGLYPIESAGFRGAEAMDILTRSAKLSAMGFGDMETITRAEVGALLAFHNQGLTAAQATDILMATVQKGNMPIAELAGALGRINAIAATMGLSFDQVGAAIATFTHMGVSSAEAVTGLRAILMNLEAPSKRTKDALAAIGTTADDVRKSIGENGLAQTLITLIERSHGNIEVLHDLIPNVRGLAEALSIAKQNGTLYLEIGDAIKNSNGLMDEGFKKTQQTAAFMWSQIEAQIEVVFVQFGTELLPKIKELVPVIKNFLDTVLAVVEAFGKLSPPAQTFIEVMLGLGIVGGPVLSALGRLLDMWIKIRLAILGAKAAETGGIVGGLAGGAAAAGTAIVGGGSLLIAGGMAAGVIHEGPGSLTNTANGLGLERQTGGENILPFLPRRPGAGGAGLSPEIEQLFGLRGQLTSMGNSGVGMVAGTQASDIVGGLQDVTVAHEKASAAAKAHAKHLEEYANASKDYATVVAELGDDLYQGIAHDHARGVSTAALADTYQVSETIIKDVIAAEASEAKLAKQRDEDLKETLAHIAAFEKIGEAAQHSLQNLGPQHVLRDLAAASGTLGPISARQLGVQTINGVIQPGIGLIGDPSHGTGVGQGMQAYYHSQDSVGDSVRGTMAAVPQILQQAFTGGGGMGGALKAMGVNFGASLFSKDGAVGGLMQKGITALFGADGPVGKMLGNAIPVIGAMIGPAITALVGMFHKPEYKKIMADSGRDWGFTFSEQLAQQIQATEKKLHLGRNEATLMNLSSIIKEDGGLTDDNLGKYESKLRDVFSAVQTHTMTAAEATKVLDENFQAFATAATDKTGLLDGHMRELIALNQQFGTDSKQIAAYLKTQAADVAAGFTKVALGFTKPIQDAYEKLQALKTDGKSGAEHDAQIAQAQEHLTSVTDPARFARQGDLASLTIANSRASGMGLVDAFTAIGPALDNLAKVQKDQNLSPSDELQHLLALRGIIAANPELFGAMDGLKGMATGLANSNQMTPEAYATIASEAFANLQSMTGLGMSEHDALDASKETLQVLYELKRRDPSLTLTPEMQKLLDQAKTDGLVGDKQLSAADRAANSLSHIQGGIDELVRRAGGTVAGDTPPTGPGTGPTVPGPEGLPVPPEPPRLPHGDEGGDGRGGAIPMAAGGDFLVTRPTLFLAGEAGIERATFSGAGKTMHPTGGGAPVVNQYTSYAITVNVKDSERARTIQDLLRQEGVEIMVEEIEDGRHAKRLQRALQAVA